MTSTMVGKCLLTALLAAGSTMAGDRYSFAVIGDMPYNPVAAGVQVYPADAYIRVISAINAESGDDRDEVNFTVHVGDIKGGATRCDNNVYTQNLTYFNSYKRAVIFTPGDNEWTDCHRTNNGAYVPVERLGFIRTTFFPNNQSLGQNKRTLTKQAGYPENSIWKKGPVLYVTLHQPGSNNNHQQVYPGFSEDEYTARNAANMAWLNQAFAMAAADNDIKGVAIFSQANPFERFLEPTSSSNTIVYTESGYSDFITNLRAKALTSGKRVVYFGGDTHYMRLDQPMTGTYPGCVTVNPCVAAAVPASPTDRVNNFSRVEVFAQNDVHWIKVEVDEDDPGIFKFNPRRVPGN